MLNRSLSAKNLSLISLKSLCTVVNSSSICFVSSALRNTVTLKGQIDRERITLNGCMKDFQEQMSGMANNFKEIGAKSTTAIEKLDKLSNVIASYHAVKINGGWLD